MSDPYAILGIPRNSSVEEASAAFKKLAKKYHPDSGGPDASEEKFKEINAAMLEIKTPPKPEPVQRGGDPFDVFRGFAGFPDHGFARQPGQFSWSYETHGHNASVTISFEEMMTGRSMDVNIPGIGTGVCSVPAGCMTNDVILCTVGDKKATVLITVNQSKVFRRASRYDLEMQAEIPLVDYILGAEHSIPSPSGKSLKLKIHPGMQPNSVLRVPGHGVTWRNMAGDLTVRTRVLMPTVPEDRADELRSILG